MRTSTKLVALLSVVTATTAVYAGDLSGFAARYDEMDQKAIAAGFMELDFSSFLYTPYGAYKLGALWPRTSIEVCWVTSGEPSAAIRREVSSAIEGSWSQAVNLKFTGWKNCASTADPDIKIDVGMSMSATNGLGNELRGKDPAMLLVVDYSKYDECRVKDAAKPYSCLRANAIHEFGHALGLAHENHRPDAKPWCKDFNLKPDLSHVYPVALVGDADLHSIMNHCNPNSLNDGKLSAGDIKTIRQLYSGQL